MTDVKNLTKDYRGTHSIRDSVPIHKADLVAMKEKVRSVDGYISNFTNNDFNKLKRIASNPTANVKIYRASPVNQLNHGDWVTNNRDYAHDIKVQNGGKVFTHTVKAHELHLPKNIEDNPSTARFSAFQYKKQNSV